LEKDRFFRVVYGLADKGFGGAGGGFLIGKTGKECAAAGSGLDASGLWLLEKGREGQVSRTKQPKARPRYFRRLSAKPWGLAQGEVPTPRGKARHLRRAFPFRSARARKGAEE